MLSTLLSACVQNHSVASKSTCLLEGRLNGSYHSGEKQHWGEETGVVCVCADSSMCLAFMCWGLWFGASMLLGAFFGLGVARNVGIQLPPKESIIKPVAWPRFGLSLAWIGYNAPEPCCYPQPKNEECICSCLPCRKGCIWPRLLLDPTDYLGTILFFVFFWKSSNIFQSHLEVLLTPSSQLHTINLCLVIWTPCLDPLSHFV